MVVWGGDSSGVRTNTGSRYDPVADTWSATSITGAVPIARSGHGAVWTGSEMVVWGGALADYVRTSTGARYDPVANEWTPTSVGNGVPSPRNNVRMVWTGSEAMVWGGDKPDGGRYCAHPACEVHTWYRDADDDGYGRSTDTVAACDQPPSYGALPGDCNDVNTAVHPGAIEACDGNDDNCDGTIDENGAALCDDGDPARTTCAAA